MYHGLGSLAVLLHFFFKHIHAQGIAVSATAFHRRGQANEDEENSTKDDVVICIDIADVAKMYHYEMAGSSGTSVFV